MSSITWPSDSAWALSYWWSMMIVRLSCTDTELRSFKNFGVTSLIFWRHVTSSVTWPLDSAYVVSYWRSIVTMHLWSCTVTEIWGPKDIVVTTLAFGGHVVTWRHRSRDHRTRRKHFPIGGQWWPWRWPYGDTGLQSFWGHEFDLLGSRDVIGHVTIRFGICGFLLVVHWNHASILHRYGDIKPQSCICPC